MTYKDKKPNLYVSVSNKSESDYVLSMFSINGISMIEPKISADICMSRPQSSEWDLHTFVNGVQVTVNILSQDTFDYFYPLVMDLIKKSKDHYEMNSRD